VLEASGCAAVCVNVCRTIIERDTHTRTHTHTLTRTHTQGVEIARCRVLEASGCAAVCANVCKGPTQKFFTEGVGLPLTMVPNFETKGCSKCVYIHVCVSLDASRGACVYVHVYYGS